MNRSKRLLGSDFSLGSSARARLALAFSACLVALAPACSGDESDPVATGGVASGGRTGAGTGGTTGGTPASTGGVQSTTGGSSGGTPGTPTGGASAGASGGKGGAATAGGATSGGSGSSAGGSAGSTTAGASSGGGSGGGAGAPTAKGGSGGASGAASGGSGGGAGAASAGTAGTAGTAGAGPTGYQPCPTTPGTPCAVLPLGDSITEGCCGGMGGGYRIELFRRAVQNGKNLTFVGTLTNGPMTVEERMFPRSHQGHGGYTIDTNPQHNGISGQITDRALSMFRPHIVLLMIGTNDINGNVDLANAPKRLGALIDDIIEGAPDALIVVATIIPTTNDGTNQRFKTYNAAIPGVVEERAAAGKHVVLVDNYAAFERENYRTALMADSLHPNQAGYAVLGREFYAAIGDLLPAAP